MAPDAEAVITAYLKTYAPLANLNTRISGSTPDSLGAPWVRVTLIDDPATDGGITDRHIAAFVQLDCYAGKTTNTQGRAKTVSQHVREALRVMNKATLPHAVVTGAQTSGGRFPDTELGEPALERFVLQSTVWMRSK